MVSSAADDVNHPPVNIHFPLEDTLRPGGRAAEVEQQEPAFGATLPHRPRGAESVAAARSRGPGCGS